MVKISETTHITKKGNYKRNPVRFGGSVYLTVSKVKGVQDEYYAEGYMAKLDEWKYIAKRNFYKGLRIFENDKDVRVELI